MIRNGQTYYGHEWIEDNQSYYKFNIVEDGIYKITYEDALVAGIPFNNITGAQIVITNLGLQIPIFTSTEGILSKGDYILLYAEKK